MTLNTITDWFQYGPGIGVCCGLLVLTYIFSLAKGKEIA